MKTKQINRRVNVTAVRFTKQFEAIPQRIEYRGVSYSFVDRGNRIFIKSGDTITRLFDMSDGVKKFRLRSDDDQHWNLLTIS